MKNNVFQHRNPKPNILSAFTYLYCSEDVYKLKDKDSSTWRSYICDIVLGPQTLDRFSSYKSVMKLSSNLNSQPYGFIVKSGFCKTINRLLHISHKVFQALMKFIR
jgi:hypothetical protein